MKSIARHLAAVLALGLSPAAPAAAQQAPAAAPAAPTSATPAAVPVPVSRVEVIARLPHDPTAFTEGLLWHDGHLYESTGREGVSDVRRTDPVSGKILARATIPSGEFGEGLALDGDTLISLTWHDGLAHRWHRDTLKRAGPDLRYTGEGWGLTRAPEGLIMSDGTTSLRVLDPVTLAEKRRIPVTIAGRPLRNVNELEWVDGAILANVWHTGFLVTIDPVDGHVTRVIDARALVEEVAAKDPEAVLNGIAWDAKKGRLFVTGKLWPTLFEIAIVDDPDSTVN
ncbi:glutaminyl-peptide cyclotransferase [Sphingomonas sp.]|uniref:glutaminyl-peptide cyclotransferase n=1 Tax=Sphingomonas sp. TaxID=28214 RepID=UPI002C806B1A|nr:glutaminyl-peptide cyclotransferase [Sphingomonas sp.]HWK35414.1 glutaminyl-peptide cyclotransferase [Sphingomonas sp.]